MYEVVYGDLLISKMNVSDDDQIRFKKEYPDHGVFACFDLENDLAILYACPRSYVPGSHSFGENENADDFVLVLAVLDQEGTCENHIILDYNDSKYGDYAPLFTLRNVFMVKKSEGYPEVILISDLDNEKKGLIKIAVE